MNSKHSTVEHSTFKELHKHTGSENYEVLELLYNKLEIARPEFDLVNEQLVVYGKNNPAFEKDFHSQRLKISILGDIIDSGVTNAELKSDGSLHGFDFYSNWIVNGDTIKHKFNDPFSNKEIENPYEFEAQVKNPEKWMEKFIKCYNESDYTFIYVNSTIYFFRIDNKWYFMEANVKGLPNNLEYQYPPKEEKGVRMVDLVDIAPKYYHPQQGTNDNGLIKLKEYESTFFEKEEQGLGSYSFSAGWWYLEIYMPLGDTLRIKRYSNYEDPELELYKVPAAYGGREDVLFIIQKPEEMFPEQVGGMYVIRPRDIKQPERRYKSVSYGTNENGEQYIIKSQDTTEFTEWNKEMKK